MSMSSYEILVLFSNFAVCLFPSQVLKRSHLIEKPIKAKYQIQQYSNKKIKLYNSADSHVWLFDACRLPETLSLFRST